MVCPPLPEQEHVLLFARAAVTEMLPAEMF